MGNELNCSNPFGDYESDNDDSGGNLEQMGEGRRASHEEDDQKNAKSSKIYKYDVEHYDRIKARETSIGNGSEADLSRLASEGNRFITDGHL